MRVALLADIHANLPALRAVLAHSRRYKAEAAWNMGDSVGYGPFPNETLDHLRAQGVLSILGDYDNKVLNFVRKESKWRKKKHPEKIIAFKWAYQTLTPDNRLYLRSLSWTQRFEAEGYRILLVHGRPDAPAEYLDPHAADEQLHTMAEQAQADIIICGHSHTPFAREIGGAWIINPGSVGRPDDGDPRAGYTLLTFRPGQVTARYYRIPYNVTRVVSALERHGLPATFARMFTEGRNLDTIHKMH